MDSPDLFGLTPKFYVVIIISIFHKFIIICMS